MIDEPRLNLNESDEVCPLCFGTGTHVIPGKGGAICECRTTDRNSRLKALSRIPRRYENCSFQTFLVQPNTTQDTAMLYAKSLVSEYPAVERGLLLMGPSGTGKTHLAVSIVRGLIDRGFASLFYEFGSLLKEIQESYNPISQTSELKVLAPIFETEILVLDELGASIPSDWVRDTMYQIINKRYNDNRLTIFTTNFLDKVVYEEPEPTPTRSLTTRKGLVRPDTLSDRIGVRLRSRLHEMCMTVQLSGADYRIHRGFRHIDPS